jgi:hypothetical protein
LPPLVSDAVDRARRGGLIARGRARISQMTTRLRGLDVPGWFVGALRWPASDRGELVARNEHDASVALVFSIGAANGRSQVALKFEPSANCDEDSARTVAARVSALLQSA